MNKKIIISFLTLILLSFSALAYQNFMSKDNNNAYIMNVQVEKGWNIIAGTMPAEGILSTSDIKIQDILAMWSYSPTQKKYIRIHPEPETEEIQKEDEDNVLTSAMWIYSNKAGMMRYTTLEDYPPLSNRQLNSGWNFVTITIDMYNGKYDPAEGYAGDYFSWDSIKGNCNYEKVLFWNPMEQKWINFNTAEQIKSYDFDDFMGLGMIVKVPNACTLKSPGPDITQPPALPN